MVHYRYSLSCSLLLFILIIILGAEKIHFSQLDNYFPLETFSHFQLQMPSFNGYEKNRQFDL